MPRLELAAGETEKRVAFRSRSKHSTLFDRMPMRPSGNSISARSPVADIEPDFEAHGPVESAEEIAVCCPAPGQVTTHSTERATLPSQDEGQLQISTIGVRELHLPRRFALHIE